MKKILGLVLSCLMLVGCFTGCFTGCASMKWDKDLGFVKKEVNKKYIMCYYPDKDTIDILNSETMKIASFVKGTKGWIEEYGYEDENGVWQKWYILDPKAVPSGLFLRVEMGEEISQSDLEWYFNTWTKDIKDAYDEESRHVKWYRHVYYIMKTTGTYVAYGSIESCYKWQKPEELQVNDENKHCRAIRYRDNPYKDKDIFVDTKEEAEKIYLEYLKK